MIVLKVGGDILNTEKGLFGSIYSAEITYKLSSHLGHLKHRKNNEGFLHCRPTSKYT